MPRFIEQGTWTDGNGVVVDEGTCTVYLAGLDTLATIYAAETGSAASGSTVESDEHGHFEFWVSAADYGLGQRFKYTLSKTSYTSKDWDDIQIFPTTVDASHWDSFAEAVTAISTSEITVKITNSQSISANTTLPSTFYVSVEGAGEFNVASGKTLTFNSPEHIDASPNQKIFTGSGTVAFTNGGTVFPNQWTKNATPNTTDMGTAMQAALDSIPRGTVELLAEGYLSSTTLTWPLISGTTLRHIVFKGQSESNAFASAGSTAPGNTYINYTGSGTLFDLRSGTDANNKFDGSIRNMTLYGPSAGGSTIGIDAYQVSKASFNTLNIMAFGTGFELNYHAYFSEFYRVWLRSNGIGFDHVGGLMNKTPFVECMFSLSTNEGYRRNMQASDTIMFRDCYLTGNGSYGASVLGYFYNLKFDGCYFENNTTADLFAASDPWKNSTVMLINNEFDVSGDRYAVKLSEIGNLISIGNTYNGYDSGGGYIADIPVFTKVVTIGDSNNTLVPFAVPGIDVFSLGDTIEPGLSFNYRLPKYKLSNHDGNVIFDSSAKVPGDATSYVVGVPGASALVDDLDSYTATTTAASTTITITAGSIYQLVPGSYIKLATETFEGDDYAQILKNTAGSSTLTLDKTADNGVTAQALTYKYANIFPQGVTGLYLAKDTTSDNDAFYTTNLTATDYVETGKAYVFVEGKTQYSGEVMFTVAGGVAETVLTGGGADFEVATGVLTGTTGNDTKVTLSAHTNGRLYVENRSGDPQTISLKIVDGI